MRRMQSVSLSREMERALVALGADVDRMRIERRAAQVRAMWADIVDEPIVRHTNAVYIKRTDEGKELIAYVDESMYAAELNARRELIKLQFLRRYGEEIGTFKILISRGRYKHNYPFARPKEADYDEACTPQPLQDDQRAALLAALDKVDNPELRKSLERAASADMAWKNGAKVKNDVEPQE